MRSPWRSDPSGVLRPGKVQGSVVSPFAPTYPGEKANLVANDFFEGTPETIIIDAAASVVDLSAPTASLFIATGGGQSFMLLVG